MYKPLILIVLASTLQADFRYDSTTKITGGAIVGMMKFAGALSKDARRAIDPIAAVTIVRRNQMLHRTADETQIIDLDQQTITRIHNATRTYSVITFAQMQQALDDMSQKMQPNDAGNNLQFDVSVKETGQRRAYLGLDAREVLLTFTMKGTDAKSGQQGAIDMSTDMWIAPGVPGYDEVRDFYRRMSEKLAWTPGASPMLNRPDIAKAMGELYRKGATMDGMPVYEVITMSGAAADGAPQTTTTRNSPPPPSVGDALGGALAGRLGLGGFGRKKKPQDQPADQPAAPSGSGSGSLVEMTLEVSSYSAAPADPAMFQPPPGFSRVEEDAMPRRTR